MAETVVLSELEVVKNNQDARRTAELEDFLATIEDAKATFEELGNTTYEAEAKLELALALIERMIEDNEDLYQYMATTFQMEDPQSEYYDTED